MDPRYQEYAKLLVEMGLNVQKGQNLIVACPVECAWFGRLCAQAAYDAGAREVIFRWRDDALSRMHYLCADDEVFDEMPQWEQDMMNGYAQQGAAYLSIAASDPENLKGVPQDRLIRTQRVRARGLETFYRLEMSNGFPWCIGSIPIPSWAKKVFPDLPEAEAMEKLWDAIFKAVRITGKGDAVELWRKHDAMLKTRMDKLNELHLESLHYRNSLGTDLTIRLPKNHVWAGGSGSTTKGQVFMANMPTEEIFTAPQKDGIDGVVYASMPLSHDGNLIDGFHFVIEKGKIVEAHAKVGEETLKTAITVDEGASYFGEVALVPYDSPIRNQEILFYNTLFDENAACHLAFGEAYSECIRGGEHMSREELAAEGLNASDTHVDFMVGTADLSIIGRTRDGREVPIFENGNFAL